MLDILPSGGSDEYSRPRRQKKSRRTTQSARPIRPSISSGLKPRAGFSTASSRVVQMDWKLPARLRKPIREQLKKERQLKKRREAILRFKRRPLNTRHLLAEEKKQLRPTVNTGAEHHTGDIYKQHRAQVRVALPPYAGAAARFMQQSSRSKPVKALVKPQRVARTPAPIHKPQPVSDMRRRSEQPARRTKQPIRPISIPSRGMARQQESEAKPFFEERDIAYDWNASELYNPIPEATVPIELEDTQEEIELVPAQENPVHIQQPKSRFALPLSFSIWPKNLKPAKKKIQSRVAHRSKKHAANFSHSLPQLVLLLAGFATAMAVVWNLQGAGRGTAVLGSVQERAEAAYEKIGVAQSALANTNFVEGEAALSDAEQLFQEANSELKSSLAATSYVLKYVDVTGTVRSGEELLSTGESLTRAGQAITRGAAGFYEANIFATKEGEPIPEKKGTLTDAVKNSQKEFGAAIQELDRSEKSLAKIDSPFLPKDIAEKIDLLKTSVPKLKDFLQQFQQKSDILLRLLGADQERQYLLLFTNNHELRPNGGFIGSIGLVHVDSGQVENIDVSSVYDPDGQLKEYIAPPYPLLAVNNRWYMRDANWFIDYKVNAKKIAQFFEKEGGPTVDGVFMITPEVIKKMLEITGPIEMPQYNVTVTAENIQQVTQQQVTYDYDKAANKPKQFMADLAPILMNRLFTGDTSSMSVIGALSQTISTKDLLMYFKDDTVQGLIEQAGWAGVVPKDVPGFLSVNNANIGGHKSDQFVEQEIDYRVEVKENGEADAVVTIRRTHHGPDEAIDYKFPEGEDPSKKNNIVYQRVLVPMGATLLDAEGFTSESDIPHTVLSDADLHLQPDADVTAWQATQQRDKSGTVIGREAGYTFFANWIIVKPGQTTVSLYRYRLPNKVIDSSLLATAQRFVMYVSKQPGDARSTVRVNLSMPRKIEILHTVPEQGITQEKKNEIVYRGKLSRDVVVGAVFEP